MGPQHSLQQLLMVILVLGPCVGSSEGYSKDIEGMPADAPLPRQPSLRSGCVREPGPCISMLLPSSEVFCM